MKRKISSFNEIKKSLEATFSYLIVEKEVASGGEIEYQELMDILVSYADGVIDHDVYVETISGKAYIVVKLRPNVSESLLVHIFNCVPKDSSAYLYENAAGNDSR
jgi:hypothetical protein